MSARILRIDGQRVFDCGEHFHVHIREPWWGAHKKFGWEPGTPGIGLSKKLLEKAERLGRKIKVSYYKNRKFKYLIGPAKFIDLAGKEGGVYMARGKVELLVIPATELEKLPIDTAVT